jgi:hypothetical protein
MAITISTAYGNKILDALFNAASLAIAMPYVSLHTADPGATGASEVTGGSYARQALSCGAANAKAIANDVAVEFALMPASTVTHFGIWDALAGAFVLGGPLTAPKAINAGDTFRFPVSQIAFQQNN